MRIVASHNLGDAYRRHTLGIGDGVVGRAVVHPGAGGRQ